LLQYKDGSRKHITRQERDSLILSREAKPTTSGNYLYIGQPKTFHAFQDLSELIVHMTLPANLLRHYLDALIVIFELGLERETQREETPEAFALRLEEMGCELLQAELSEATA
jgi:hypothetical protein